MSDSLVPQFLEYTCDFMHEFITSVEHQEKIELRFEEVLLDDASRVPLIQLALEQGAANRLLLNLHAELLRVLHIIAFFNVKYSKPIERLFSNMENVSFFADLRKPLEYELAAPDLLLKKERTAFLCKSVTEAVALIREDQKAIFLEEHLKWMVLIMDLTEIWQLDRVEIRQQQIVQLYAYGWDSYAEALLELEKQVKNIGPQLLAIAGQRLKLFTQNDPKAVAHIAGAGHMLFDYLEKLVSFSILFLWNL